MRKISTALGVWTKLLALHWGNSITRRPDSKPSTWLRSLSVFSLQVESGRDEIISYT